MVESIKKRTKQIALDGIRLSRTIPETRDGNVIAKQLIRSSTSVGANYRAALRAKSKKDFVNKLRIVEEEADETLFWLELLEEDKIIQSEMLVSLKTETAEILAITVASIKTSMSNLNNKSAHLNDKVIFILK
jgi:four helix bundle protein